MAANDRLLELGTFLESFSDGQRLTPDVVADIQQVLDEALITLLESGAHLPTFIVREGRIAAARRRLGPARIANIASHPLSAVDRDMLLPLVARMCSAFDTLSLQRSSDQS